MYQVIDKQTQAVIGTYQTRNRASNKKDKMDMAHGAYRYIVKSI